MSEREPDNSLPPNDKAAGQNVMEGIHRKSYSKVVIEPVRKRARVFVGDSIVRKTDRVLNKGDDVVVCLPGAKIEAITERVENIVGSGKGGSVLVHVGINNIEREGTPAVMAPCKRQVKATRHLICTSCSNWLDFINPGVRSPGLRFRQIVLVLSVGDVRG